MTDIRELLGEVAEQAKVYDVTKPVVQVARRRARIRWLAPVAAAAAVAVAATVGWVIWPMAGDRTTPDAADKNRNAMDLDWLPTEVRPPSEPPPVLPTDRAVGSAALVYASCEPAGCYGNLLMSGGTQYRLTEARQPKGAVIASASLSRDGRWLGRQIAGEYLLRDLTGVRTHRLPGTLRPVGWSPDSRWVALEKPGRGAADPTLVVVDLWNFRASETTHRAMGRVWLLNSGEILYSHRPQPGEEVPGPGKGTRLRLYAKNPATGRTRMALDVDLRRWLRPGQAVERFIDTLPTPDGTGVVVRTMYWWEYADGSGQGTAGDFFRVTWRGQVNRYEMPVELPREPVNPDASTDELWAKNGEHWGLAGQFGKDLLLRHYDNANADLQALDTRTGELRTVCRLPKGITELFVQRGW